MSDTQVLSPAAQQALAAAENGDLPAIENAWLEMMEAPPRGPDFYEAFFRAMRRAHELDKALDLLVLALDAIEKTGDWQELLDRVEQLSQRWPEEKRLRPIAARALKGVYAGVAQVPHMLAACKGLPLDKVFPRFRLLLNTIPGEAWSHTYWGEGIVQEVDIPGNKVTLTFPGETKTIGVDFLLKHLEHQAPDSFLGMRTREPEKLAALADESPLEAVKLALKGAGGRIKQTDLKALLLNGVVEESAWTGWWARARRELQLDPMVDFRTKGGAHAEIALRDKPKTIEEEASELFFGLEAGFGERVAAVQKLTDAGKASGTPPPPELVGRMRKTLMLEFKGIAADDHVARLQAAMLAEDLAQLLGEAVSESGLPEPATLLDGFEEYEALATLESPDHALRALHLLLARDGDEGFERAAELFPRAPSRLAQAIWRELDPEHHAQIAVRGVRLLFEHALENPDTYLWAVRSILEGRWQHLEDYIPRSSLVLDLFDSLDGWHQLVERGGESRETISAARHLLGKVRALLQARNFEALGVAAEELPIDQVRELRRTVQLHNALAEAFRNGADRQITLSRRELEEPQSVAEASSPDAGSFYCTVRGHHNAVQELHELNTVTIPANAKEIEVARAEGDLRENAGYHGARDKHVLLLQRAHELGHALSRSRVVRGEEVKTEAVAFGTAFEARNLESGGAEEYIVLGRWESNPDIRVFSYQAPFIQQFFGRATGQELNVTTTDGREVRYRVEAIRNALAGTEWDRER